MPLYTPIPETTETHLNITLDGEPVGTYDWVPSSGDQYYYNVLVYSNSDLDGGEHQVVISAEVTSIMEFDYAVYSFVYHVPNGLLGC
jgi:hypothetical protein